MCQPWVLWAHAKHDFQHYATAVSDDFQFIVKADRAVTQNSLRNSENWVDNSQFLGAEYATRNIVAPYAEGLGQNAGVLLFQFPPVNAQLRRQPAQFAEHLHKFLSALPEGIRYAIEFREATLMSHGLPALYASRMCTTASDCIHACHHCCSSAASWPKRQLYP